MASQLQNILTFNAVAPAATVLLPHLLNIRGRAVVPDKLWVVVDGTVTVTADDTNVSVTNDGAANVDVTVLAYHDHSINREFGDVANKELLPQPLVMVCTPAGSSAPSSTVQSFRFTATAIAQSAIVALPAARANNNYLIEVTLAGVTQFMLVDCPVANRTTTQFTLTTSTSMAVGDAFDIVVRDPS